MCVCVCTGESVTACVHVNVCVCACVCTCLLLVSVCVHVCAHIIVMLLIHTDIAVGASKAMVVTTQIDVPLLRDPPLSPISNTHIFCKGAVLSIDFHPKQRLVQNNYEY